MYGKRGVFVQTEHSKREESGDRSAASSNEVSSEKFNTSYPESEDPNVAPLTTQHSKREESGDRSAASSNEVSSEKFNTSDPESEDPNVAPLTSLCRSTRARKPPDWYGTVASFHMVILVLRLVVHHSHRPAFVVLSCHFHSH